MVVLASEPVGGRSQATELPCFDVIFLMYLVSSGFLAPPAERQRSFSNADLSVVVRRPSSTFHLKSAPSLTG